MNTHIFNLSWAMFITLVLSLGALFSLAPLAHAAGNTWYVDAVNGDDTVCDGTSSAASTSAPSCALKTIAAAVANSSDGDTIMVAAGTYSESVVVNKSLTLLGPNANIDPNTGSRTSEAVINSTSGFALEPEATSVTINGFSVTAGSSGEAIYNVGSGAADVSGLTIEYSIVTGGVRAISIESNGNSISILNNRLQGYNKDLVGGDGTWNTLKIDDNYFLQPTDPATDYSIQMGPDGTGPVNGFEFKNNHVYWNINIGSDISNGTVSGNTFDFTGDLDMQIVLHHSTVSGNTFNGHNATGCFQLFGSQYGLDPSSDVSITNNTFTNCGSSGGRTFAIQLSQGVSSTTISANTITGAYDGVDTRTGTDPNSPFTDPYAWSVSSDTHINNNTITGSTHYGVSNTAEGTLDATKNWWGTNSSSSVQVLVSSGVTYSPWYADSDMTTLTDGSTASTTISSDTTLTGTSTASGSVGVTVDIPAGTVVTGAASWDGTISAPTATTTTVTLSGFTTSVTSAVAIGSSGSDLTFDKGVRLSFAGQAGKSVGWYNAAGAFTEITDTCSSDSQAVGDALAAGGSCKINVGSDLIVWTKHFSTFVTYTATANPTSRGGGGGGGIVGSGPLAVGYQAGGVVLGTSTEASASTQPSVSGPTGAFMRNLAYGSTGADVEALQKLLIAAGYDIPFITVNHVPYGFFGPETKAAVMKYQTAHGLPSTGFVGPLTRAILNQ
jgi:hypothetical protein